jgi:selenide, water dikinase
MAEADGNRTRLSRDAAHTGFEDRGAHQDPDTSKQAF